MAMLPVWCLLLCSSLVAEPVRLEQAQEVTDIFLRARQIYRDKYFGDRSIVTRPQISVVTPTVSGFREVRGNDGSVIAYVAELEPHGFVATSADTEVQPIVAYSFQNPFPTEESNPLVRLLKEDMRIRTKVLAERLQFKTTAGSSLWDVDVFRERESSASDAFQQWPPENTTSTGGWLETTWHQDSPFNNLCPLDPVDGLRSYVGCLATALAQVVHYHCQCKTVFSAIDSYTTYTGIDIDGDSAVYDFPSFKELNAYLATIQSKYQNKIDVNDMETAALSYACGVALGMDYSSEGSSAYPYIVPMALMYNFNFYSAAMTGGLSNETYRVLQENIINGLPALLGICPADGWGGHELVCDGYNTNGEYHLNFGWGHENPEAITEAWYRLPAGMPLDEEVISDAILNIQPQRPGIEVKPVPPVYYSVPGQPSNPRIITIRNVSSARISIDSILSPQGFQISRSNSQYSDRVDSFQINPSGQTMIYVRFYPDKEGSYYGPLEINYGSGKTINVILSGCAFTGGTKVPAGDVSGYWSKDNSPYFVTGDIIVPENMYLFIEPGVKVIFTGQYGLTIDTDACLMAVGEQDNPIEFTAWNQESGWTGLRFLETGDDDFLSYCSISFSNKSSGMKVDYRDEDAYGGAVYCYYSSPTIENCKIINNRGEKAGGIYCDMSDPVIINTLIANNSCTGGTPQCGGICLEYYSFAQIKNCTIVNNFPGGIFAVSSDEIDVNNTILWGNDIYQIQTLGSTVIASFCDIQGGYLGRGNIDMDPCFFAPSNGSGADYDAASAVWTLLSSSPCINAGADANVPIDLDLAGNPRVQSNIVDIGAYENQSDLPLITITPSSTVDAGFVHIDANVVTSFNITNTGTIDFEISSLSISDVNGAFSVISPIQGQRLSPSDSVKVEIMFKPVEENLYTGTLMIQSTSSNAPFKPVILRGVGVSGTIIPPGEVSGKWTKAESPFSITGDIFVPEGQTLTIEPGVVVRFAGHFSLTVGLNASLHAVGMKQENVVFTPTDVNEGWFGIRFIDTGTEDILQYCTIECSKKPQTGGSSYLDYVGGAIICIGSSPTIDHCFITHNQAAFGGAVGCMDDSAAVITHNWIVDNQADSDGAGIFIYSAGGTIAHNVIANNSAFYSGGILNSYGSPSILNNTIVCNRPNAMYLEPVFSLWDGEQCSIRNNIIWKNEIYANYDSPSDYDIRFNEIQGGYDGEGNVDTDPCFADLVNKDYHLKSQAGRWDSSRRSWVKDDVTSLCIDAGDPNSDYNDELWPNGGRINMGAYGGTVEASMSLSSMGNPADLNGDGSIDTADLAILSNAWLTEDLPTSADINHDNCVNLTDFAEIGDEWRGGI
jgi:hypothetical protein